ncbi:unnamed protein product [Cylindrotheca closterium]|uniref:Uncharacterized protein n=1 Tax=Cylindrotheca closterium TaxID=2856 RepID=A0AAD2FN50_9STRA|nr:unnamed protein product [Cylindrotheca closterium]
MDPDNIDRKMMSQLGSTEQNGSITPEESSLVVPKNSDLSKSSKSDEGCKMSNHQKTSDDGLESSSTKESSSTPSPPSQERSPLHNTKPNEQPSKSNEKEEKEKGEKDSKEEKSKLRKGKWTVEEEQYTAHIIKCFNDGLLTLPEGSTLRGYLADRLNCNPMRITKKFTGACGLTRRVYHLHDRRNASPAEVERAKAELNHLEQRFRMRVEQEQSGLPLSHRDGIFHSSQVQSGISPSIPLQHHTPATYLHPWTQSPGGGRQLHTRQSSQFPFSSQVGHWMLPNPVDTLPTASIANTVIHGDTSAQFLTNLLTSYLAQVAAASMAAPSTLLPQQQQQQPQISKRLETTVPQKGCAHEEKVGTKYENLLSAHEQLSSQNPTGRLSSANQPRKGRSPENDVHSHLSPVQQLQRGYEAHLESLRKSSSTEPVFYSKVPKPDTSMVKKLALKATKDDKGTTKSQGKRSEDDEGTILLLDFMKSAQRACGDPPTDTKRRGDKTALRAAAVPEKGYSDLDPPSSTSANELRIQSSENPEREKKYRLQPVAVTDTSTMSRSETSSRTSSQPTESSSSIEDSDSKSDKTDPSSGEESEKESAGNIRYTGPPRKRLKKNSSVKEFTAQNLAEHSRMMDKRNTVEDKDIDN